MPRGKAKKGIGFGGRPLKEMLEEKQRLYGEKGFCYGLEQLPLAKEDPLKLEVLASRLLAATVAGRETIRMISASPLSREVSELAIALYTPEGDCVLQSTGIIIHVPLMGQVIEWMIKEGYEQDPGIRDGDCFTCNDNYVAGMHPSDIYDITPIFYEDELVGWVGTVIMMPEQGAVAPGCMPSSATERFVEGLRFTAEKSGCDDTLTKAFERRVRLGCRLSDLFMLDRKAAFSGNIKVREEIKKIIKEYGAEFYVEGVRELIEIERRAQRERVKRRTVPGRFHSPSTYEVYNSRSLAPPHHALDSITLVPVDFHIKPDGKYFLDFDGCGSWGWHASNLTPSAITGAACMILATTIAYTGRCNTGTLLNVEFNAPYDTFAHPTSPHVATSMLFAWPITGGSIWMGQQSRAFFSRGFIEEFRSPAIVGTQYSTINQLAGKDHFGRDVGLLIGETPGVRGSGGFANRDGILADPLTVPAPDMGNVEVHELICPLLWVGRRLLADACGWGKYRSGYSILSTFIVYKTPLLSLDTLPGGHCSKIYPNAGTFGGYTGAGCFAKMLVGTHAFELAAQRKPLAHGIGYPKVSEFDAMPGKPVVPLTNSYPKEIVKHGDMFEKSWSGSPGFGDPIDRDPALAKKDLDNGLLTIERCRRIYCVEAKFDEKAEEWVIDEARTAQLRDKKKKERLASGVSGKEWWQKRRRDVVAGKLPPMLKAMYNDSLAKGKRWPAEFRQFWHLPEDFAFKEA